MPLETKHPWQILTEQRQSLGLLVAPSGASAIVVIVLSLVFIIGSIGLFHYHGSSLQLLHDSQASQQAIQENSTSLNNQFSSSQLVDGIVLLILWGGIGAIAYSFTMSVIRAIRNVVDLKNEVNYIHADRQQLIWQAVEHVIVRLLALGAWLLYIRLTLHVLLPYMLAVSYAASGGFGLLADSGYILWDFILLCITLHINVVFLRLLFLRPRIFG